MNWCTECKEIFTWNECGNLKYIWNTKEHKAGEEVATHKMVKSWSCIRTKYNCVNDKCENSKACYAFNIGFCEVCNDDLTGTAIRAKLNFACKKCGKEYDEAGAGHEIDHKKEYAEHLLISNGKLKQVQHLNLFMWMQLIVVGMMDGMMVEIKHGREII